MIVDTMSVEDLREWVKSHCVLMIKDFRGTEIRAGIKLNAGEWYEFVGQDQSCVEILCNDGTVTYLTYAEMEEYASPLTFS